MGNCITAEENYLVEHQVSRLLLNQIPGPSSQTRFLVQLPGFCRVHLHCEDLRGLGNSKAEKSGTKQSFTKAEVKAP